MRPAYSATIGAPPLLIVDTDSVVDEPAKSSIPEALSDEPETSTQVEATTSPIETTTTTTLGKSFWVCYQIDVNLHF